MSQETLAPWEITPAHLRALRTLKRRGTMRLSELSEHLHIAPAPPRRSSTHWSSGPGAAPADPGDRRATLVEVTEPGVALLDAIRAARGTEAERVFSRLSPADRADLARILGKLRS